jgi:hypothetical protein
MKELQVEEASEVGIEIFGLFLTLAPEGLEAWDCLAACLEGPAF